MCIVSNVEVEDISNKTKESLNFDEEDIYVEISLAKGDKCDRCWTVLPEVKDDPNNLCKRCNDVCKHFNN